MSCCLFIKRFLMVSCPEMRSLFALYMDVQSSKELVLFVSGMEYQIVSLISHDIYFTALLLRN